MSSILEALKKLEAEKNAQLAPIEEPEPDYDVDYTGGALLGNVSYASPRQHRLAPLTLVLAGGIFTMLLIGISVLLAVLLIERSQPASTTLAGPPSAPMAAAIAPTPSSAELAVPAPLEAPPETDADDAGQEINAPVVDPEPAPAPKPAPRRAEVVTPVSLPVEVRYEPYVPEPAGSAVGKPAPLPSDIRDLPMLSRGEREQYRLEGLSLNMLNEANALRPTGNAIINLEKVFVGETLPGSNARLVDVQSHGIAIEIQSTRQRYYIPR